MRVDGVAFIAAVTALIKSGVDSVDVSERVISSHSGGCLTLHGPVLLVVRVGGGGGGHGLLVRYNGNDCALGVAGSRRAGMALYGIISAWRGLGTLVVLMVVVLMVIGDGGADGCGGWPFGDGGLRMVRIAPLPM
jgi:hypothetical protein